ncbi:MAG: ATP-dependent helicase UvrD/PcrA, partial [Frankiales bacterium]|nr:ATP-dependent helicase UvrD/PcrA [Frankiales bacterium]
MGSELTPSADGHYLRALLDKPFTDRQLEIVTARLQPQLVIAGAGSGKTMVMAARVVHAVAHFGLSPARILGLTFTNKASGELAERVRTSLAKLP